MSGGCYDYLYCKEPEELFSKAGDIEDMASTLEKLNCLDVARDIRRLAEYIKTAYNMVDVLSEQLKPIMKAVEWYEDNDIGEDTLKEEVERYRQSNS